MTEKKPSAALTGRVSKATAEKILRAAADIDAAGDEMIELQELLIAAEDAGISPRSFEMSVAEYRWTALNRQQPRETSEGVSYLSVAGVGVAGAVAVVAAISAIFGPAPGDIIQGAIAAGAGSITAVIAYLRSRGGGGSSPESVDPGGRPVERLEHLPAGSR